jgi:hypothetical protein
MWLCEQDPCVVERAVQQRVVNLEFSSSVETRRETTPATIALCLRQRGATKKTRRWRLLVVAVDGD